MNYTLYLKEEAVGDMQQAYEYYEEQSQGLGERFLLLIEEHLQRIAQHPLHYPSKRKPYREIVVNTFPYVIIYEIEKRSVVVYAVFHTAKNPKRKPKIR